MGLILDSTVFIQAERQGENARQILTKVSQLIPDQEIGMSFISLMELAHGIHRADTPERKQRRGAFVVELSRALPVYPITKSIAFRAAFIDAEATKQGKTIAVKDLLIGATALDLDYWVATENVRDFTKTPNLRVVLLHG